MSDDIDYGPDYYHIRQQQNDKAEALRQRQLQDQQRFKRLENRQDFVAQPGVVGTRTQAVQRAPLRDVQPMPVGEQIVRNASFLKQAIMPTPMKAVPPPKAVSVKPYTPKVQQPMNKVPSILYTGGMPTGMPVKKWPTSFKKAFHKPTYDEMILKGLNNLDNMSNALLGNRKGGR